MPSIIKPMSVIKAEGNKNRLTKADMKVREDAEKSLATEESFKEWTNTNKNKVAHKEFLRLKRMFKKIDKDDALLEGIINRYCLIHAECFDFETKLKRTDELILKLEEKYDGLDTDESTFNELREFATSISGLIKQVIYLDKQIMAKRKMLLDIEKENIMTIASQLRSIPKKEIKKDEEDPMAGFMNKKIINFQ